MSHTRNISTLLILTFWSTIHLRLLCLQIKSLFLRNTMMMIICSKVKSISTHANEYTHKKYSVKALSVATFATFRGSYIQETTSNSLRSARIILHKHTNNYLYDHTIIRKYNLHTHTYTHTHTQKVAPSPNVLLTVFFDSFLFLQYLSFPAWWLS